MRRFDDCARSLDGIGPPRVPSVMSSLFDCEFVVLAVCAAAGIMSSAITDATTVTPRNSRFICPLRIHRTTVTLLPTTRWYRRRFSYPPRRRARGYAFTYDDPRLDHSAL